MTERTQSLVANAEAAFDNKQYSVALEWYQKALNEQPDDLYVLSRAGSICIPLGKFKDALQYFGHAKELNPENGDVLFNYANACFFNHDYVAAFENYVAAEKAGCSDDVTARLYYQLAMICSMREDTKAALIYFKKCEEADRGGLIALNPDMISEKLKLYMMEEDYPKAAECAEQLVAIAPADFKNYMVLFSILMANKEYARAESVLQNAEKYAEKSEEEADALQLQLAALYIAQAETEPDSSGPLSQKAIGLLENLMNTYSDNSESYEQVVLALSEAYIKVNRTNDAIRLLTSFVFASTPTQSPVNHFSDMSTDALEESQIEEMADNDMRNIQSMIDSGELSEDIGASLPSTYDEYGNEVRYYGDVLDFLTMYYVDASTENPAEERSSNARVLSPETRDKVLFSLLTCYLDIEDFEKAYKTAGLLKHSDNKYYSYFGIYSETMSFGKISKDKEMVEEKYTQAIAFFKNKMFADPTDALSIIFRARLYAEQGKYARAEELVSLLAEADQTSLQDYISQCKSN